jgi:murein DD-endopeptidase MepM/ murein hydrolase activator NlpD
MKVPPVPRGTAWIFFAAFGLLISAGCGGGHATRVAAEPAVRMDRPAPATPAAVRAGVSFEEDTVREERLEDGGDRPGSTTAPAQADRDRGRERGRETDAEEKDEDAPVRHVLSRGQTLYSVARMYGVEVSALMKANGITNARKVSANTSLVIPLSRPPRRAPAVTAASIVPLPGAAGSDGSSSSPDSGTSGGSQQPKKGKGDASASRTATLPPLAWPIQGAITAPFGKRGREAHHEGIDIDGETGDPIHAAATGTVVFAGTHGDYGRTIVIDHGDGLRTVYAHASTLKVAEGDPVRVGETIAEVGHSGNARGSHLHFEVRRDGRPVNPIPYLRSNDLLTAGVIPTPPPHSKPKPSKSNASAKNQ